MLQKLIRPRMSVVVAPVAAALAVASTFMAPAARTLALAGTAPLASSALAMQGSCASLASVSLPNTAINSAVNAPDGQIPPPLPGFPPTPVVATCRVHATVTTPGADDRIGVDVWLPVSGWNGRFQGVGGSGFVANDFNDMAAAVDGGYSAAGTDAGHTSQAPVPSLDGSFALDSNGHLNKSLIEDFAYRGVHGLAIVGKAVTGAYYGSLAKFAYWNGCSTGGRQGLAEAQRYPSDFNGILAGAPAINWQKYVPASALWPELVMQRSGDFLPQCKFDAFQAAAVKACDSLGDGVVDGVIGDPLACHFDPHALVGTATPCGTITAQDADIVARIVAGPRTTSGRFLWYGLTWGAPFAGPITNPFDGLANTTTSGGKTIGVPFPLVLQYLGTWVQRNPPVPDGSWDWTTTSYSQFEQLFHQSVEMYGKVMGTDDPDLRAFKRTGGKLLMWHGLADQLIFPQGSINYYNRVQWLMGGSRQTTDFARLFLAPGATHCGLFAPGPVPDDPLGQLVQWVENANAPAALNGVVRDPSTGTHTRFEPAPGAPRPVLRLLAARSVGDSLVDVRRAGAREARHELATAIAEASECAESRRSLSQRACPPWDSGCKSDVASPHRERSQLQRGSRAILDAAPQYKQTSVLTRVERIWRVGAGSKAELVWLILIGRPVTVERACGAVSVRGRGRRHVFGEPSFPTGPP